MCDGVSVVPTSTSDYENKEYATKGEILTSINHPAVRSDRQRLERKEKYKGQIAKNRHLWRSDCSQASYLGLYKTKDYRRVPNGQIERILQRYKKRQLNSLQTTILPHYALLAHTKPALILAWVQKTQI